MGTWLDHFVPRQHDSQRCAALAYVHQARDVHHSLCPRGRVYSIQQLRRVSRPVNGRSSRRCSVFAPDFVHKHKQARDVSG